MLGCGWAIASEQEGRAFKDMKGSDGTCDLVKRFQRCICQLVMDLLHYGFPLWTPS